MAKHVKPFVILILFAFERISAETYYGHESEDNVFGNPEFDSEIPGSSDDSWYALGDGSMAYGTTSDSCFSGCSCAYVRDRSGSWMGLHSRVPATSLSASTRYWVSLFVKITSYMGTPFNLPLIHKTVYNDGKGDSYDGRMALPITGADDRWLYMSSDITTPEQSEMLNISYIEFYVDAPTNVDYMLDATGLTEIAYADWRATAEQNIETYRKTDLQLNIVTPSCMNPQLVSVKIEQTKNSFAFGSMTKADILTDYGLGYSVEDNITREDNKKYRDYFKTHFDWTVFNHRSKWRQMENAAPIQDDSKFVPIDEALDWLDSEGKTTRGHCILWNNEVYQPDYVKAITDNDTMLSEINRRIDYMTDHYRNRFAHYDVSNEHASGFYFEDKTGKRDILQDVHMRTREGDNETLLFTNNYYVISYSLHTAKAVNEVRYLQENADLVHGIGIQGHFSFGSYGGDPLNDLEVIQRRLDIFRGLDLPIWITELDSDLANLDAKADFFEDVYTMFYGTPEVSGVLLWGIEQLVDDEYQNNAVGAVVERLIQTDWRTKLEVVPSEAQFTNSYRAFYGEYELTLLYDGTQLDKRTFNLDDRKDLDVIFTCP